ncbi:MAG TPA: ACT domain-containing protein [Gammaproteobacteria bacterium]|nr:ACT domain-containing protein [Gammaproteobacteria bacterium]
MDNNLVIAAIGTNSPTIIEELTRAVSDCGCNIGDSRLTIMGNELCAQMIVTGSWDAIAKIEDTLRRREQKLGVTIITRRTTCPANARKLMPYAIDVVGLDQAGIVHNIVKFIVDNNIIIQDIETHTYQASSTTTTMFSLHMNINIPSELSIASIRGDFMDYCDQLNLDAIMEPVK